MRKTAVIGDISLVVGMVCMVVSISSASRHQETILGMDWFLVFTIGFFVFVVGVFISDMARRW